MYELFYNFLIEELLVRYFKKITVEPGDKFYIVIEDSALRQDFYKALHSSAFTEDIVQCIGVHAVVIGKIQQALKCLMKLEGSVVVSSI